MSDPTPTNKPVKPRKPRPSFPLSPHANGQWYTTRRINGRKEFFYFGRWDSDPAGVQAEESYLAVASDLNARRFPTTTTVVASRGGEITIGEVVAAYLDAEEQRMRDGEIGARQFDDIRRANLYYLLDAIPEDTPAAGIGTLQANQKIRWLDTFRSHLGSIVGVYRFNNSIGKVRRCLKWAHLTAKILPVALHDDEALARKRGKAVKRSRRLSEETKGVPIFSPEECRRLVLEASKMKGPLLAFILLGLNAGMGQSHISDLPHSLSIINLVAGRVDWVRIKAEELFQFTLWPITVVAINRYLARRPAPKAGRGAEGLLFVTKYGHPFVQEFIKTDDAGKTGNINPDDAIGKEFDKLQRRLKMKKPGRGFYGLRRTFGTTANDVQDQDATLRIMGHALRGMDPHYVRKIPWQRIENVTSYVGHVLLGPASGITNCSPASAGSPFALPDEQREPNAREAG